MSALLLVLWGIIPSPDPTTDLQPTDVTPGLIGFLATFALVIVTVLLIIDMSRRIRRLRFRQRAAQDTARLERQIDDSDDAQG